MTIIPGTPAKLVAPKTALIRLADGTEASVHVPAETVVQHEGANGSDREWARGVVLLEGEVVYQLHEIVPVATPDPLAVDEGEGE